jgi:NTP pyrophosphatase (non-canonical NTP hydrolase)
MTFHEYQTLARRTQNARLTDKERMHHALHGLASEVGEIHGLFQKLYQGHELDDEEVVKELGDLLWFAAEFADSFGLSLGVVAHRNILKLKKRYPDGFSAERSVHRQEFGGGGNGEGVEEGRSSE